MDDRMQVFLLLLSTLISCASADCEACVDGECFSRKTLIHGYHVTDRLAIDSTNNVLYVQLNSNLNTAFYLDDLQIHLIQTLNTTDMAFNQAENVLYTAGPDKKLYKYNRDSNTTEEVGNHPGTKNIDLIFSKDTLYYTSKNDKGLFLIEDGVEKYYNYLVDFNITDFVVTKAGYIYFIANESVYLFNITSSTHRPILIARKKMTLSIDRNDKVYFGDAAVNSIYKVKDLKEFVDYGAYKTGSVDRFVFDKDNNVVFHDKLSGDVVAWKSEFKKCNIHAPHSKYNITVVSDIYNETNTDDETPELDSSNNF